MWKKLKSLFKLDQDGRRARRKRRSVSSSIREMKHQAREEIRVAGTRIAADVLALQSSIREIASAANRGGRRLAVLSILPPSESGVARFTLETFRAAGFAVDIFSAFERPSYYLNYERDERLGPISVWHVDALPAAHRAFNYDAVVVVLANSTHNLPIAQAMRDIVPALGIPVFVQIHDPRLNNLARRMFGTSFEQVCSQYYPTQELRADLPCTKMVLGRNPIAGIVVHSDAALDIVANDFGVDAPPIHKLFHPVFASKVEGDFQREHPLTVGTFGVPGRDKCTIETLEAFRIVRGAEPNARLILAGYQADKFASRHASALPDGIEIYSSPSDQKLIELMSEVDVAVQLRRSNNGESSGAVPQLLCLKKSVIASPVGAFKEYGDAVAFVDLPLKPEGIADCILRARTIDQRQANAIAQYAEEHTAEAFCEQLERIVWPNEPDSRPVSQSKSLWASGHLDRISLSN